ncbi:MAG: hypothetical protein ABI304_13735 [Rudaea sp.]
MRRTLNAIIAAVGHQQMDGNFVDRQANRHLEFPRSAASATKLAQVVAVCIEYLNAVIAGIHDHDVAGPGSIMLCLQIE